ncbi:MAG TPA: type II toxin-antitoxin system RelE/ParE family toxin [Gallionellaceae bacterium]|nr:type II toxin-antitoxin system RelE/ParE family toxin [Gallionellaceae bacterium]
MIFYFHPEAEAEFEDAVAFYEDHAVGLGLDFAVEVREAIEIAVKMPLAWTQIEPGIRRVLTQRFPFAVLYSENGDKLFILAVMHLRRDPDYWHHRTA